MYANKGPLEFDMGYITFYQFRKFIADNVSDTPSNSTIKFLESSDC